MRLQKARVQNYRSILDTGYFDVENKKTILVGPNEAGKTAVLQALQKIHAPAGIPEFNALRDYPRSLYNNIDKGIVKPSDITVVEAIFSLDPEEQELLPDGYKECSFVFGRRLDNTSWSQLSGGPNLPTLKDVQKNFNRLCVHIDQQAKLKAPEGNVSTLPSDKYRQLTKDWELHTEISGKCATDLKNWLNEILLYVDEKNEEEETRYDNLLKSVTIDEAISSTLKKLEARIPVFVLFNNYHRVRPIIHLERLAERLESKTLDDTLYDYGNECLLKFLGFSARDLSNLGKAPDPAHGDQKALEKFRARLDTRAYKLNAASVQLTEEIRTIWKPNPEKDEADKLRIQADGQYLKVVVEDELGVEVELDQRSEGFQWLVSFFIVFFAEAQDKYKNAILLLDEPGLSLHGLKQREFRATISRLANLNQTIYTTHSPFLVGPDELDLVRVVEMENRKVGTKIHSTITAGDPAALLPLQEALGYDLAQSLFGQQRNLVLEGLTDSWYMDATAQLLRDAKLANLNEKIAQVTAGSAGKVVYYATILHAQKLKVAALLDSDSAGDQAAQQEVLVHKLGNKNILRTKDYISTVTKPEIEDLLRDTLVNIAKNDLGWDVSAIATSQPNRPIIDIFTDTISDFSKYKLAKAYLRWTRNSSASELTTDEISRWTALIATINKVLN